MRLSMLCLAFLLAADPRAASAAADLRGLEQAWTGCVRDAYLRQLPGRSRAAAQRGALDECRGDEDAYVAAVMAARLDRDRPLTERAKAWAAFVAAQVVDPLAAWFAGFRR